MPAETPVTTTSAAINDLVPDGRAISIVIEASGAGNLGETEFLTAVRARLGEPTLSRDLVRLIGLNILRTDGVPTIRNAQDNPTWTNQLVSQTPQNVFPPIGATDFEFPYFSMPASTDSIAIEAIIRRTGRV